MTAYCLLFCTLFLCATALKTEESINSNFKNTKTQIAFIANQGQWEKEILYAAKLKNANVLITTNGLFFDYYNNFSLLDSNQKKITQRNGHVIEMNFGDSKWINNICPVEEQLAHFNYFLGNNPDKWVQNVKSYNSIVIKNVYNNIDALLSIDADNPRYDFIVHPGANPKNIKVNFNGIDDYFIKNNNLIFHSKVACISHGSIFAYQVINGEKTQVKCSLTKNKKTISFDIDNYNKSIPLIIDPTVLASYFGGSQADVINDVTANREFYYVCGYTYSEDFHTTAGAYSTTYNDNPDAFVAKFKIDGAQNKLIFSSFIGSDAYDMANAIAIDSNKFIYIAGQTDSKDFPQYKSFSYDYNSAFDVFITKFDSSGNAIKYSALLGGNKDDVAEDIAVNLNGEAFIAGYSNSTKLNASGSGYSNTNKGGFDAIFAKVNNTGELLRISSFIGGAGDDKAYAITIDNEDDIYLTGETASSNFPVHPYDYWPPKKPYDAVFNGKKDAFITKFQADGTRIVYSTYFGGTDNDIGKAIAIDEAKKVYVAGETYNNNTNTLFTISNSAYQSKHKGGWDAFFMSLDQDGLNLNFSTYLGSASDEFVSDLVYSKNTNSCFIAGYTNSNDFPIKNADKTFAYNYDGFITEFNTSATQINYSTLIGGKGKDIINALAVLPDASIIVAGETNSNDLVSAFYPKPATFQDTFAGGNSDGFVAKFVPAILNFANPNGGGNYCKGNIINIKWNSPTLVSSEFYNIDLWIPSENVWRNIKYHIQANEFDWTIPNDLEPSSDYKLRVAHVSGLFDEIDKPFTINQSPIIEDIYSIPDVLEVCEDDSIKLTAKVSGKDLKYFWRFNANIIPNKNDSVLLIKSVQLSNQGNYDLYVEGLCSPGAYSKSFNVSVIPKTKITLQPTDVTVEETENAVFKVNANGSNLFYYWMINNSFILGENNPTLELKNVSESFEGAYTCIVAGTCGSDTSITANLIVNPKTDVKDSYFVSEQNLWFNCLYDNDFAKIKAITKSSGFINFTFYNIFGQKIGNSIDFEANEGVNYFNINTNEINSGTYWIVANGDCGSSTQKIIIVK